MNPDEMKRYKQMVGLLYVISPIPEFQEALERCLGELEEWTKVTGFLFPNVSCSQCGKSFGPGNHGYSHCSNHTEGKAEKLEKEYFGD